MYKVYPNVVFVIYNCLHVLQQIIFLNSTIVEVLNFILKYSLSYTMHIIKGGRN